MQNASGQGNSRQRHSVIIEEQERTYNNSDIQPHLTQQQQIDDKKHQLLQKLNKPHNYEDISPKQSSKNVTPYLGQKVMINHQKQQDYRDIKVEDVEEYQQQQQQNTPSHEFQFESTQISPQQRLYQSSSNKSQQNQRLKSGSSNKKYRANTSHHNIIRDFNSQNNQDINPRITPLYQDMTKNPMTDDRKMIIILKKEIEDYRSNVKKIQYNSKKDMMIKLLIDELDKQHKRINFFESKIKDYKSQMLRLEDALQVRSHRLLLRSAFKPGKQQNSLGVDNITNSKRSSRAQSADVSRRQQQQEGIAEESNEEASITNQQIILGSIQESPIYLDENNNSPRSLLQYDMMDRLELDYRNQQELQSQYLNGMIGNKQFSPRSQGIKVDLTPEMKDQEIQENGDQFDETIFKRESFILSSDNQKYVKAVINREDLLQDICGKDQSKRQIEQNVTTLIHDLESNE
eukprot:403372167